MVLELTKENFEKEVKGSDKPVIIDAFASWCGPCQQMKPIFENISEEFKKQYKFISLNIDDERDLAIKYGVTSIPTFIFIKDSKVIGKENGYMSHDSFVEKIKKHLG